MYDIMIVEDDGKIASMLEAHIRKYGYNGIVIDDFDRVLDRFRELEPHMVLLDINLPSFDGYYWCRQIRAISTCPIIVISARSGKMDQLMALENGADDYMTKPFHYEIVMAKIRNQLRRAYGEFAAKERVVSQAGLLLYPERMELHLNGKSIVISKKETVLLETLLERSPRVVSRETILDKLWDDTFVDDNTLSVNITRIRKRLAELGIEQALETVRGSGYRLNPIWLEEGAR
ncbi:response regulator transcription factor [Paenibacillus montanisoli]|uniref:DNA-binding response regulator n=1 Tax=Paenibacillus montanisoli TaxID=2081970 RepID=A0A328TWP5_9BACL|nr:response regulator transcription factor [Paenibacillus montanisoli]RAP74907.1 DNA-binding response regulator [Paenibacillus montanisoli]